VPKNSSAFMAKLQDGRWLGRRMAESCYPLRRLTPPNRRLFLNAERIKQEGVIKCDSVQSLVPTGLSAVACAHISLE